MQVVKRLSLAFAVSFLFLNGQNGHAQLSTLKVRFMSMNPHVGQKFEFRVVDKGTRMEVGRVSLAAIANHDFDVELEVVETGHSYWIDFYADFNMNGLYDAPPTDHAWRLELNDAQGDTTLTFTHNTTFTDIMWPYMLTLNLTNMNPHVGQQLSVRVVDVGSGMEVGRKTLMLMNPDTAVGIPGIVPGRTYDVDFFADLNKNGVYDAPPTDHAWRLTADNVAGDTQLDFSHNTNFTDIQWPYALTLNLLSMNPHLGQLFEVRVIDLYDMREIGRVSLDAIVVPDFKVVIPGLQTGHTYRVDYYADFNKNGMYDAPPADHAWREQVTATGDAQIDFTHSTNFTDIKWTYQFTLNLSNMNPHLGQAFQARVIDLYDMSEIGRVKIDAIRIPNFEVKIAGIKSGRNYWVDFYADLNKNGQYDAPPADHAWRETFTAAGNTSLNFNHNTNFTDIAWPYLFTLHLNAMNPHVGQQFQARVVRTSDGAEIGRASVPEILVPDFAVRIPGIQPGVEYRVDYFADLNKNGLYDTPPMDHAWRDVFSATGDASVQFTHNTNFTDIDWDYLFTLHLNSMNPHVGQLFELRVVDESNDNEVGRTRVSEILQPDFAVHVPGIRLNGSYRVDYYADFNKNGQYDAPPADHAWREMFTNTTGNVDLQFTHNTNFTDIQWPPATGIAPDDRLEGLPTEFTLLQNYPNPFNPETTIRFDVPVTAHVRLVILNSLGQQVRVLVDAVLPPGRYKSVWNGRNDAGRTLSSGLYYYQLQSETFKAMQRMILLK